MQIARLVAYTMRPDTESDWEYVLVDDLTQAMYRTCVVARPASSPDLLSPERDLLARAVGFLKGAGREAAILSLTLAFVVGEVFYRRSSR